MEFCRPAAADGPLWSSNGQQLIQPINPGLVRDGRAHIRKEELFSNLESFEEG